MAAIVFIIALGTKAMAFQDEVQTLMRLRLTFDQARVYLALAESGMSAAKTIAKNSGVARTDVYRIMPTLEKLGLVERIVSVPCKFRAMSRLDAVSVLMKRRTNETSELRAATREMLKVVKNNNTRTVPEEEGPQFILVPKEETLILRSKQAVMTAQRSIDVTITWKRLPQVLLLSAKELRKAIQRGVKVRFIAEKTEHEESWPEIVQALAKNPSFKLRSIPNPPNTVFWIIDDKEVFITTSTAGYAADYPALWSNNPSLISAMHDLFEIMWLTSLEDKHKPN
jgi:sugar-specific transcriptional regulator TrmB